LVKLKLLIKSGPTSAMKFLSQYGLCLVHALKLRSHVTPWKIVEIELPNLAAFSIRSSRPYPGFQSIFIIDYLNPRCLSGFPSDPYHHRSVKSFSEPDNFGFSLIVDLSSHRPY
jgi:hypothetical protein